MTKLTHFEYRVLEMLAGRQRAQWGAAVSVSLERLASLGLCTRGPNFQITEAGRAALQAQEGGE